MPRKLTHGLKRFSKESVPQLDQVSTIDATPRITGMQEQEPADEHVATPAVLQAATSLSKDDPVSYIKSLTPGKVDIIPIIVLDRSASATIESFAPTPPCGAKGHMRGVVDKPPNEAPLSLSGVVGVLEERRDCDYWDRAEDDAICRRLEETSEIWNLGCIVGNSNVNASNLEASSVLSESGSIGEPIHGPRFLRGRGELIGRGSLGSVYKALDQKTGQIMAVKEAVFNPNDTNSQSFLMSLKNELNLYKDFQNPHIVSYLGHDYAGDRLYIYLEYMPGGSISQVLSDFGPLDEMLCSRYMNDLLSGLQYLHTRDPPVLHRDIKGANVLVGIDRTVKLADFGCSKCTSGTAVHTLRGSIPWMAPEVMCNSGYGRKADIWSLGCTLIEMLTARAPWGKFDNCIAAMARIALSKDTPPIPEHLSTACANFVSLCTSRAPKERPDAEELLKHEFVTDLGDGGTCKW